MFLISHFHQCNLQHGPSSCLISSLLLFCLTFFKFHRHGLEIQNASAKATLMRRGPSGCFISSAKGTMRSPWQGKHKCNDTIFNANKCCSFSIILVQNSMTLVFILIDDTGRLLLHRYRCVVALVLVMTWDTWLIECFTKQTEFDRQKRQWQIVINPYQRFFSFSCSSIFNPYFYNTTNVTS